MQARQRPAATHDPPADEAEAAATALRAAEPPHPGRPSEDRYDRGPDGPRVVNRRARAQLEDILQRGLRQRHRQQLHGYEEWVYVHLIARQLDSGEHQVCERCLRVFRAKRAWACPACRRNPPRPAASERLEAVPPDRAAATKTSLRLAGNRLSGSISRSRGDRRTRYRGVCECGEEFMATDARQIYCPIAATTLRARRAIDRLSGFG